MEGVNPYSYMQRLAGQIDTMDNRVDVESALDDLEYLFEVTDPEIQDIASDLIARLKERLQSLDAKS
jgi:hypothetical protein